VLTLCQKLIKIDILLSHVKLNTIRKFKSQSKATNKMKITCKEKSGLKPKYTRIGKNREPIGFGFGLGFPAGLYYTVFDFRSVLRFMRESGFFLLPYFWGHDVYPHPGAREELFRLCWEI
jgi:hypothetical protein